MLAVAMWLSGAASATAQDEKAAGKAEHEPAAPQRRRRAMHPRRHMPTITQPATAMTTPI